MKRNYWISFSLGIISQFIFAGFSFLVPINYLSRALTVFTDINGSVMEFGLGKLIINGLMYLAIEFALFCAFVLYKRSIFLRESGSDVQSRAILFLLNILGFYIGFAAVGLMVLWVARSAFSNFG